MTSASQSSDEIRHPAATTDRAFIIFNPTAGRRRRRRLTRALARLAELGVSATVRDTTAPGDARAFAAAAEGAGIVAVAGGDGTINEAVNGLIVRQGGPALAIVPLGTANVLAAELGFPDMRPETAAEAIAAGDIRPICLGFANGRVFCQMAGIGFDAHVVAGVDVRMKRRIGKLAYVFETLRCLARYRPRYYAVEIDGVRYVAASAVIANGHFYAGRYTCAPDASLDVPVLKACLFLRAGRWHVLRYAFGLLTGRLYRYPDIAIHDAHRVRIVSLDADGEEEPVQGDGDIVTRLPVEITVAPQRLAVVRPRR